MAVNKPPMGPVPLDRPYPRVYRARLATLPLWRSRTEATDDMTSQRQAVRWTLDDLWGFPTGPGRLRPKDGMRGSNRLPDPHRGSLMLHRETCGDGLWKAAQANSILSSLSLFTSSQNRFGFALAKRPLAVISLPSFQP